MGQDLFIQLALARKLEAAGLHVLTIAPARFADGVWQQLIQEHAAGVLAGYAEMADPAVRAALEASSAAGLPVAAYDECGSTCGFATVSSDQAAGGADLTRWMLAHGRRRLLCFQRFPSRRAWMEARWSGHRRAMAEAGLSPRPLVVTPEITQSAESAEDFASVARLLTGFLMDSVRGSTPIDGILASTDQHAYQVAGACRLLGLSPGTDVLIAGYDHLANRCLEAQYEPAGLAVTVDKDTSGIAARMADMLLDQRSAQRHPTRHVVVPHRVVEVAPPA
jgi:LacI family transcriptional regulator